MKRSHGYKEQTELQKARAEIASLKRQVGSLRKQLSRSDVGRYQELLEAQDAEDFESKAQSERADAAKAWKCWTCNDGTLRITILERRDGTFYYRMCDGCGKRTKTQKYMAGKVEGVPDADKKAVDGRDRNESPRE